MKPEELRLEVLKLAHAHGRSHEEVLGRAAHYEMYILEGAKVADGVQTSGTEPQKGIQNSQASSSDKRPQKKSENLDSLI